MADTVFIVDVGVSQDKPFGGAGREVSASKKMDDRGEFAGRFSAMEADKREEAKEMTLELIPSSPVSVLEWSPSSDEGSRHDCGAAPSAVADHWNKLVDTTVSSWNSWEAPAPCGFWLDPDLTPRDLRAEYQGTAAFLLALFSCFPSSSTLADHLAKHLYAFWQWNDWLMRYAEPLEIAGLADFLQHGVSQHLCQGGCGNHSKDTLLPSQVVSNFPGRLNQKYPCKKEEFLNVLSLLKLQTADVLLSHDSIPVTKEEGSYISWLTLYLRGWLIYAKEGLARHVKMREVCRTGGQFTSVASFLEYRALSSPLWILFSAASHSASGIKAGKVSSILPLLVQAAMLVAVDSDLLLAARKKAGSSPSITTLLLFPHKVAMEILSTLVVAYAETKSLLLQSNAELAPVVELLEGTVHGLMTWHDFAQKHEAPAGTLGRWRHRVGSDRNQSSAPVFEKLAQAVQEATVKAVGSAREVLQLSS